MTTTKLYMVRHAKSPFTNGQEKIRGLSDEGSSDADKLVDLFKAIKIDACYSSDYLRAEMTIKPLADYKGLTIVSMIELRERRLKPETKELSYECFLEAIKRSYENLDFKLNGGESIKDVQNRAIPTVIMLLNKHIGKSIVVGTHGNIMTAIFNYYDKAFSFDFWQKTSMPDVYELIFEDGVYSEINRIDGGGLWKALD